MTISLVPIDDTGLSTGMGRYQAFLSRMQSLDREIRPDAVEEPDWYQVEPGYRATSARLIRTLSVRDSTRLPAA